MPQSKRQKQEKALLKLLQTRNTRDHRNNFSFWAELNTLKTKLKISTNLDNDTLQEELEETYGSN